MNILPCIRYLLQTIPIKLPNSFIQSLKKVCRTYLWNQKCSRIRYTQIVKPKTKGGTGFPDIQQLLLVLPPPAYHRLAPPSPGERLGNTAKLFLHSPRLLRSLDLPQPHTKRPNRTPYHRSLIELFHHRGLPQT